MCALGLVACGGGGGGEAPAPPTGALPGVAVSGLSAVEAGCTGGRTSGTVFANTEVEPTLAVSPLNPQHLVAAWQQDRASNGGARAVASAVSRDGGSTWSAQLHPFSRCGGATAGATGDHERATDPWVDIGPDGTVHLMALAFSGANFTAGSRNAMLVSRSVDGGRTYSAPVVLHSDAEAAFNDKNTLTADPTDARYVYAVWDRLEPGGFGPAWMARSSDGGASWEPARAFYNPAVPGGVSQTIGNRIVVFTTGPQRGTLVNIFVQIDTVGSTQTARVRAMRSLDKGLTWGEPVTAGSQLTVGTVHPANAQAVRDGGVVPAVAVGPDGRLWLAWQDSRFSGGQRDAIAVVVSSDGGLTFSTPVAANRDTGVAAFTPTLAVAPDGQVGLVHFDFRSHVAGSGQRLADAWLVQSNDGVQWREAALVRGFNLATAPDAGGLFLGDYHGLVHTGGQFVAALALATGQGANGTDVRALRGFITAAQGPGPLALPAQKPRALSGSADGMEAALRQQQQRGALAAALRSRLQ